MDLKNNSAIVTGAAQGMGREFAEQLASAGANVAVCDVKEELLQKAADRLRETGVKVLARRVDVSHEQEVNAFVKEVQKTFGRIDILINNAAIHPLHQIEEISSEEWDLVLRINLKGYFFFAKAVIGAMRRQKYGRIINIASEAGKNGGTICALHYAAAKGGVLSFTRNLAKQVGTDGITVNAIAPGRIATAMAGAVSDAENQIYIDRSVVKRLGKPADIANAVLFLASPRSSFVTGETLNINGGTLMD
jgi:3-oxoacyl-[acyl-carrier protein] reductase